MHFIAWLVHDFGGHLDSLGRVLQDLQVLLFQLFPAGEDEFDVDDMVQVGVLALDPGLSGVGGEGSGDRAAGGVHFRAITNNLEGK